MWKGFLDLKLLREADTAWIYKPPKILTDILTGKLQWFTVDPFKRSRNIPDSETTAATGFSDICCQQLLLF